MTVSPTLSAQEVAARRAARLAAVQALYGMEQAGGDAEGAVDDLRAGQLPLGEDGPIDSDPDPELFQQIVSAAVEKQAAVDTRIAKSLAQGWRLERIDAVARAILRAGAVELWARPDIATAIVIDEYVEIAKAFFEDGPEPAFINGALDAFARAVREDSHG